MRKNAPIIASCLAVGAIVQQGNADLSIDLRFPASLHTIDAHHYQTAGGDQSPITIQAWAIVNGASGDIQAEGLQNAILAIKSSVVASGLTGNITSAQLAPGWNGSSSSAGSSSNISADGIGDWGNASNTTSFPFGTFFRARTSKTINNAVDWGDSNSPAGSTYHTLSSGGAEFLVGTFTFTPNQMYWMGQVNYVPVMPLGGTTSPANWWEDTADKTTASPTGNKTMTTGVAGPKTPNSAETNAANIYVTDIFYDAWTNSTNTNIDWSNGSNWHRGFAPDRFTAPYFNLSGSYNVNVTSNAFGSMFFVKAPSDVTLNITGNNVLTIATPYIYGHLTKTGAGTLGIYNLDGGSDFTRVNWQQGTISFLSNPITMASYFFGSNFIIGSGCTLNFAYTGSLQTGLTISNGGKLTATAFTVNTGGSLAVSGDVAVNTLTVTSGQKVTLNSGSMRASTFDLGNDPSRLQWNAGQVIVANSSTFPVGAGTFLGSNLLLSNSGKQLQVDGTLQITNGSVTTDATSLTATNITVGIGGSLTAVNLRTNALILSGNASVDIPANGSASGVSVVKSINQSNSGTINLHNNDLIVDYTNGASQYANIINLVKSGLVLLGGNGSGIGSTEVDNQSIGGTVLAVVDGGDPLIAGAITSLSGYTITNPASSVLVKYTWFGDSNLDGVVDGSDYALIDTGFTSSGTLSGWMFGDYDFNGIITGGDYALADTGFIAQSGALPEPGSIGLIIIGTICTLRRRSIARECRS